MAEKRRRVAIAVGLIILEDWRREIYAGIQRYARRTGRWDCIIDESPGRTLTDGRGTSGPYDGVIARAGTELAGVMKSLGIPMVNLWRGSRAAGDLPGVFPDFAAVGRLCAEHLVGRGFRRFGCVTPSRGGLWKLLLEAFLGVVLKIGSGTHYMLDSAIENLLGNPDKTAQAMRGINAWLDTMTPPVGVFMMSPVGALQVANACAARGWRVPEEVGILSGTDNVSICERTSPSLSSVDKNYERVGYEAAQLLDRIMDGEPAARQHILVPPAGIVARVSTDFFAVEDKRIADAMRFIAANLHRNIDVHDVVEGIGASRSTLARGFRKHVGRSMSEEIRRLRLETAKRMLAEPHKWGLDAIAAKAGFRDATTLCRVFRREVGVSPNRYRKQVLGDKG
jgi:LacI family transcriptional regulator